MRVVLLAACLVLSACATGPQLVMLNPDTGATVDCPVPDGGSGKFLVARACLSACQAHGFRPIAGIHPAVQDLTIPTPCSN